jgi:hypothetical protein
LLVDFATHKLRRTMESGSELVQQYGPRLGKLIGQRLDELAALPDLGAGFDVPHLKLHQLKGDRDEQFAVALVYPDRLVFSVANTPIPRVADGGVDVDAITSVVVLGVVDYH